RREDRDAAERCGRGDDGGGRGGARGAPGEDDAIDEAPRRRRGARVERFAVAQGRAGLGEPPARLDDGFMAPQPEPPVIFAPGVVAVCSHALLASGGLARVEGYSVAAPRGERPRRRGGTGYDRALTC